MSLNVLVERMRCLAVVMNNVSPPLLLVMCYGTQSNTFGVGVPEANTKEVFGVLD